MAIKINNSTIIDDSRNIVNSGIATLNYQGVAEVTIGSTSVGIGSTNKLTITPQDNEHSIGVGGTERLKLTTTGIDVYDTFTVGVGTTNRVKFIPETTQLSVGIDTTNFLTLGTNTGTEDTFTIYDSTGGLTHFTATNAGNIGVGIANPTEKLHIDGGNVLVSNGSTTIFSVNQTGTNILSIQDAAGDSAFEVTSSGSVGIGLSNPTGIFEIQQSGNQLFQVSDSGSNSLSITDASLNPAFDVTSSGKVGVGITNPSANFEVVSAGSTVFSVNDTVGDYYLEIDTDKFVVTAAGDVGIGTTNATSKLHVIGDVLITGVTTSTSFTSSSDIKLKTNIRPIENPIEIAKQLNGVKFEWINLNEQSIGVIAQDVEKVLPELVTDTDPKSVNYNGLIGVLIEAIKEQQVRIEELEKKLNA